MGELQQQFISCEGCLGTGRNLKNKHHSRCIVCHGTGFYLRHDNLILYWNKKLDAASLWEERINQLFNYGINVLVGVVVLFGIARLALVAWEFSWKFNLSFWQNGQLLGWWVAVLAGSYLFFRLKTGEKNHRVYNKQSFSEDIFTREKQPMDQIVNVARSFNKETILLVEKSWQISNKYNLSEINALCLLLATLESKKLISVLARLGVNIRDVVVRVEKILERQASADSKHKPVVGDELKRLLIFAYTLAYEKRFAWVSVPSLLLSIVENSELVQDIFNDLEVEVVKVRQVINWLAINEQLGERYNRYRKLSRFKPKNSMNRSMTAVATPYLDRFSQDLTLLARYGQLDLCVGRQKETEEIFRIIESGKDSVVLIGYDGVGKTSILEGIAERMVTEDVPQVLTDKRLVSLSIPRLVAGAREAGDLEERALRIHHEIARAGNVVLLIENVHDLVGINTEGGEGLDLSEVFADIIRDTRFLVIATTNPVEYRKSLEGKALGNALHTVRVDEPDKEATLEILESKVNIFEYKYRVYFSFAALDNAVNFSERYMHDMRLPEKAIRILEEVAVYVRKKKGEKSLVIGDDVAALVSEKTDIPLTKITTEESEKLLNLEDEIHERIVNQEEAVNSVAAALRRARTELRDEGRPIVNLLFLGPTGVGKTELAKTVAITYFGNAHDMVRLDMSEYQEKHTIDRLLGSASNPNGGLLTEGIKHNPYTVLLLDEIEKAHPDILNIFLQVMDDGRLTDWSGQTIDFTNTIIIATSNAGTQYIQDQLRANVGIEVIKEALITQELKTIFRPEFLNRFDNIVIFKPLTPEHIEAIAGLMIKKSVQRLTQKGIHLEVSPAAVRELAQAGFDPLFGARPMRRVIQEKVDDALAKFLLSGKITRRDVVILEAGGEIRVQKAERYI